MRVTGPGSSPVGAVRRDLGMADSGARFPPLAARSRPPTGAAGIGPAGTLASLDAVLALQALPDATERRRRAVRRGHGLLDGLEALRLALLEGGLPRATLHELAARLSRREELPGDPALAVVVAEIELRVAVELAKLDEAVPAG